MSIGEADSIKDLEGANICLIEESYNSVIIHTSKGSLKVCLRDYGNSREIIQQFETKVTPNNFVNVDED